MAGSTKFEMPNKHFRETIQLPFSVEHVDETVVTPVATVEGF
jgi:hypothetical protein